MVRPCSGLSTEGRLAALKWKRQKCRHEGGPWTQGQGVSVRSGRAAGAGRARVGLTLRSCAFGSRPGTLCKDKGCRSHPGRAKSLYFGEWRQEAGGCHALDGVHQRVDAGRLSLCLWGCRPGPGEGLSVCLRRLIKDAGLNTSQEHTWLSQNRQKAGQQHGLVGQWLHYTCQKMAVNYMLLDLNGLG